MNILSTKIVLASKSPRRSQLLEQAGFTFEVHANSIDETYPSTMPVHEVPQYLAQQKAHANRHFLKHGEVLLSADSVVILEGKIYEKPKDEADAFRMIQALSGTMHEVVTGVCLLTQHKERVFAGHSKVWMLPITEEETLHYIRRYQPFDKAGGYAIQEWIGLCKIEKIEGTYPNIMGLPTDSVYRELQEMMLG
ncbi:MAG: Maf family nucleotide pyrophosphatase [Bacteroidota bacterium]